MHVSILLACQKNMFKYFKSYIIFFTEGQKIPKCDIKILIIRNIPGISIKNIVPPLYHVYY